MLRDDLYFRDSFRPTMAGEFRVTRFDNNAWLVDEAKQTSGGKLDWYAVQHDDPRYLVVVQAFREMAQLLAENPEHANGDFLPEQLKQIAANRAGQLFVNGNTPHASVKKAVAYSRALTLLPVQQSIGALIKDGMVPNAPDAIQAQLFYRAANSMAANDLLVAGHALRHGAEAGWLQAEMLAEAGKPVALHSEGMIQHALASLIDGRDESGTLTKGVLWFEQGTSAHEAMQYLRGAMNFPLRNQLEGDRVEVGYEPDTGARVPYRVTSHGREVIEDEAIQQYLVQAYQHGSEVIASQQKDRRHTAGEYAANMWLNLTEGGLGQSEAVGEAVKATAAAYEARYPVAVVQTHPEWVPDPDTAMEPVLNYVDSTFSIELNEFGLAAFVKAVSALGKPFQRISKDNQGDGEALIWGVSRHAPETRLAFKAEPLTYLEIKPPANRLFLRGVQDIAGALKRLGASADLAIEPYGSMQYARQQDHQYTVRIDTMTREGDEEESTELGVDEMMDADDLAKVIRDRGITDATKHCDMDGSENWHVSWGSEMPDENRAYFEQGIETYYTLHLVAVNGERPSADSIEVFAEDAGLTFTNPYQAMQAELKKSSSLRMG